MRLRCFLLGLLVLGLLVGPALAEHDQVVVLRVNALGEFDQTLDPFVAVDVGKRIVWACVQDKDSKFKLKVYKIKQEPQNTHAPFPQGFEFEETKPCGVAIISRPMLPTARWKVYKATFQVLDSTGDEKDTWDPHWIVK